MSPARLQSLKALDDVVDTGLSKLVALCTAEHVPDVMLDEIEAVRLHHARAMIAVQRWVEVHGEKQG